MAVIVVVVTAVVVVVVVGGGGGVVTAFVAVDAAAVVAVGVAVHFGFIRFVDLLHLGTLHFPPRKKHYFPKKRYQVVPS